MDDLPRRHDTGHETGADSGATPDRGSRPGMPRWVKVAAILIGTVILVFVVLRLTGAGGEHGPGRHSPEGDALPIGVAQRHAPPASVPA